MILKKLNLPLNVHEKYFYKSFPEIITVSNGKAELLI